MNRFIEVWAALVALALLAGSAQAACYEDFGCTDGDRFGARDLARRASCQVLWEMRNGIFAENHYCFRTHRAIQMYGNAGCISSDMADLDLNRAERANVQAITLAERRKGC